MARYFFDTRDGARFIPDEEGVELQDLEEARKLATVALGEAARDALPGSSVRDIAIEVRDGFGPKPLLRAALWFEVQALRSSS
jgi:hypothetical protein